MSKICRTESLPFCTSQPLSIMGNQPEEPECQPDNNPLAPPRCQIGANVYIDVDFSGSFSENTDIVFRPDGTKLTVGEVKEELRHIGYDPDFAGCFYHSSPSYFSDLETLRARHGYWPNHFTVITATKANEKALGMAFLIKVAELLEAVETPDDTYHAFTSLKKGILLREKMPEYIGFSAMASLMLGGGSVWNYSTNAHLGRVTGWLYNAGTATQDASKRYVIAIHSNISLEALPYDAVTELKRAVERIALKYQLKADHVQWITPPLDMQKIREGLTTLVATIPSGSQAEVMLVYFAHGRPKEDSNDWETILHDGWLRDLIMDEKGFRHILSDSLPPDKITSVLLLMESCHSGMLVE